MEQLIHDGERDDFVFRLSEETARREEVGAGERESGKRENGEEL
jgi:hypothetical protein